MFSPSFPRFLPLFNSRQRAHLLALGLSLIGGTNFGVAQAQYIATGGQAQDAEAARQKILHAADQLDNIQANSEALQLDVKTLKDQMTRQETELAALKQENATLQQDLSETHTRLATLQTAFNQAEENHAKEREILVDEISKIVAPNAASHPETVKKKKPHSDLTSSPSSSNDSASGHTHSTSDASATEGGGELSSAPSTRDTSASPGSVSPSSGDGSGGASSGNSAAATPQPVQHGYYHTVASGETLSLIAAAYRDQGVPVTVAQIRKANDLPPGSEFHVGQKLFIPKPISDVSP